MTSRPSSSRTERLAPKSVPDFAPLPRPIAATPKRSRRFASRPNRSSRLVAGNVGSDDPFAAVIGFVLIAVFAVLWIAAIAIAIAEGVSYVL